MKVIITEQQFNSIKDYYILENYIGLVNESVNIGELWQKYKKAILTGVAAVAIFTSINNLAISSQEKAHLKRLAEIEMSNYKKKLPNAQVKPFVCTNNDKVEAVKKYMEKAARNQGYNPQTIQLSPEEIVKKCEQYNYDLPLLLAQAHLESCFGLTPRARKTNSVFSVGCFDNGKDYNTYATQNDSIDGYIKLMQKNYINNKSIDDLLTSGNFVNNIGKRYASDTNYEGKVKSIRNKIIKMFPVLS